MDHCATWMYDSTRALTYQNNLWSQIRHQNEWWNGSMLFCKSLLLSLCQTATGLSKNRQWNELNKQIILYWDIIIIFHYCHLSLIAIQNHIASFSSVYHLIYNFSTKCRLVETQGRIVCWEHNQEFENHPFEKTNPLKCPVSPEKNI